MGAAAANTHPTGGDGEGHGGEEDASSREEKDAPTTTSSGRDCDGSRKVEGPAEASSADAHHAKSAHTPGSRASPATFHLQPQQRQLPPTTDPPTPPSADSSMRSSKKRDGVGTSTTCVDDEDPLTCPLLVGDLVRVSEEGQQFSKRLKDRGTYLGRIKSVVTNDDGGTASMYEVEWVLGGRLQNVRRQDLVKRTAVQEGYTEQRKRSRPASLQMGNTAASSTSSSSPPKSSNATAATAPTSGGSTVGGKATKTPSTTPRSASAPKSTSSKKKKTSPKGGDEATTSIASTEAAPTKSTSKSKTKGSGAKSSVASKSKSSTSKKPTSAAPAASKSGSNSKRKRPAAADSVNADQQDESTSAVSVFQQVQEMYDRHKREFERVLVRLEKVDKFGFFLDPAPPEYDECYDPSPQQQQEPPHDSAPGAPPRTATPTPALSDLPSTPVVSHSPSAAADAGVSSPLDFLAAAAVATNAATGSVPSTPTAAVTAGASADVVPPNKKQRVTKAKPKPSSAAKAMVFPDHAPFNWAMVRRRMEHGRYVLDREKHARANAGRRVVGMKRKAVPPLHRLGIDWDLFLQDVHGMCEMALENDQEEGSEDEEGGHDSHHAGGESRVASGGGAGAQGVNGISSALPKSPPRLERGSLAYAVKQIKEVVKSVYERTGLRQMNELTNADNVHKFMAAVRAQPNKEAAMQTWRTTPFPERRYERLRSDVVCAGLSPLDERVASYELKTNLPDSFVGLSYRYDDTGQSEAWMKSVVDEAGGAGRAKGAADRKGSALDANAHEAAMALAADDGVIRAQVNVTMQTLLISVQDRVMTGSGVLHQPELKSANWITEGNQSDPFSNPELVEKPVWGIDCYTRRNILLCLEADFETHVALEFIEKWVLPAINSCPDALATNIGNAARILEGLPLLPTGDGEQALEGHDTVAEPDRYELLRAALAKKIRKSAPKWLKAAATSLRLAREALGPDFFRVHPKGHGSILLCPVKANSLVTFYRGELYPSWRWGEKMDAIEITQQRKDLKPALPDFYNMILERPQSDPRGYGLLFVDASRKAGHGSSLSHSCDPTCEVRVAALNGELCLAMTTLRELQMGEELTFDYNAVTESLNEYRSAVCLCGYGKCRGSFLHFSTADCYQQVLNRNAPIACRFANLVKGSMKLVMSEDDEKVLLNHGFRTAAFGAISVNRRQYASLDSVDCDSLDFVPVWLRTFVADTLRYIEYERRALPIALICDHISSMEKSVDVSERVDVGVAGREPTKPEPSFFYFTRTQADFVNSLMKKEGIPDTLSGVSRRQVFNKIAANYWQTLSSDKKEYWKLQSAQDFEKRLKAWKAASLKGTKGLKKSKSKKPGIDEMLRASKMSFQDADAEGISAMEQRIQQLTQSLSRIGRVLDRHREWTFEAQPEVDRGASELRKRVHSPITLASDAAVVGWIWNSTTGVFRPLLEALKAAKWARPELLERTFNIRVKYTDLEGFDDASDPARLGVSETTSFAEGAKARSRLRSALLELRSTLLLEVKEMGRVYKSYQAMVRRESSERTGGVPEGVHEQTGEDEVSVSDESNAAFENDASVPSDPGEGLEVEVRRDVSPIPSTSDSQVPFGDTPSNTTAVKSAIVTKELQTSATSLLEANSWINHYGERSALLALADLLLFYANTTNFFLLQPYKDLKSTPIEVYARELGNAVPRSAMDASSRVASSDDAPPAGIQPGGKAPSVRSRTPKSSTPPPICEPDEVIAEVTVSYSGDFVLSQLLQWYNGGIGLKAGLPDMTGCAVLPTIQGCVSSATSSAGRSKSGKSGYEAKIRPRLIEWLQDPYQRGSPWPEDVRKAFVDDSDVSLKDDRWPLFGSPVLDFLVTGDEANIQEVLGHLDGDDKVSTKTSTGALMLSVDKGRPAQAVSNWVQCENPECMKWRKIPWHVDVDLLPEKFYCKDNKWDPKVNSCDAPEDDWDEDDKLVGGDGKVEGSPVRKDRNASLSPAFEENFFIGARFDVMRAGKSRYTIGTVTKVDLSGKVKRIRFHFNRCKVEADEWVEFGSPRIAALYSKVPKKSKVASGAVATGSVAGTDAMPDSVSPSTTGAPTNDDSSVGPFKIVSEDRALTQGVKETPVSTSNQERRDVPSPVVSVATPARSQGDAPRFPQPDSRETDALAAMMSLASGFGAVTSPSHHVPSASGMGHSDVGASQSTGMSTHNPIDPTGGPSRHPFEVKEDENKALSFTSAIPSNDMSTRYGAAPQFFGPESTTTFGWTPNGGVGMHHHYPFDPAAQKLPPHPLETGSIGIDDDHHHSFVHHERQLRELWHHQQLLRQGEDELNEQREQLLALGMGAHHRGLVAMNGGGPTYAAAVPYPTTSHPPPPPPINLMQMLDPSTAATTTAPPTSSTSSSSQHLPRPDH